MMIKAVIFDMYETLITLCCCKPYFSSDMAKDAGIPAEEFKELWYASDYDRTIGNATLEETIASILKKKGCYTKAVYDLIIQKRCNIRKVCFSNLHPEIIPLFTELKNHSVKIGIISNCYSEEAQAIRESVLFPYFDVMCLSYEQGCLKPDEEIFHRCMNQLKASPEECLYIGDGGSNELEAAKALGMTAMQAVWYLKDNTNQPCGRKEGFEQIERPLDIIQILK